MAEILPTASMSLSSQQIQIKNMLKDHMEVQEWCKTPYLENPPPSCPEATAPDYCLAASRFMVAKLVGLLPLQKHLNQFLDSDTANKLAQKLGRGDQEVGKNNLKVTWGYVNTLETLNEKALPAVIDWAASMGYGKFQGEVKFVQFRQNSSKADTLLRQRVALVVGVTYDPVHESSCNHYITVVKDSATGSIWAIDPWGKADISVVILPSDMSFLKPVTVTIPAGTTMIPCRIPFFGYYTRDNIPLVAII